MPLWNFIRFIILQHISCRLKLTVDLLHVVAIVYYMMYDIAFCRYTVRESDGYGAFVDGAWNGMVGELVRQVIYEVVNQIS